MWKSCRGSRNLGIALLGFHSGFPSSSLTHLLVELPQCLGDWRASLWGGRAQGGSGKVSSHD